MKHALKLAVTMGVAAFILSSAAYALPSSAKHDQSGVSETDSACDSVRTNVIVCLSIEGSIALSFSVKSPLDGSCGVTLNASATNLTSNMTVHLNMQAVGADVPLEYEMTESEESRFWVEVAGPIPTHSYYVWITVRNETAEIASSDHIPVTIADFRPPDISSTSIEFEGNIATFTVQCSDEYGVQNVRLYFSTDSVPPLPVRDFNLVNGTKEDGTWVYSAEMDPASRFYYNIQVYDGSRISGTDPVLYAGEGGNPSISDEAFYVEIIAAFVAGTALALYFYNRKADKSL